MLTRIASGPFGIAASLLLAVAMPGGAGASEEATITAFAAWQGEGRLLETGPDQATFVGALAGTLYVETDKGPIESGQLACPAIVKIDLKDRSQAGTGHCMIHNRDGDRIYGDIDCTGYFLIGCEGKFTLTGGTGKFAGITGDGPVIIRSEFGRIDAAAPEGVRQQPAGIIYWRELHYQIP